MCFQTIKVMLNYFIVEIQNVSDLNPYLDPLNLTPDLSVCACP